ncbi:hypothetical protein CXG81DRAFT_6875, partial [Caulochytrium protostelioides]
KAKAQDEEEIDSSKYFENRCRTVQKARAQGGDASPYPHKFDVDMSLSAYIKRYSHLADGSREPELVRLAGRLQNIRSAGKSLKFYDLHGEGHKIQILAQEE